MKKLIKLCCLIGLLSICLVGCSGKTDKKSKEEKKDKLISKENADYEMKEDIIVVSDNVDMIINNTAGANMVQMRMISKYKLNTKDVKITFDKEFDCDVYVDKVDVNEFEETMGEVATMSYNGIDWREVANFINDEDKLKDYEEKYLKIKDGVIGAFFYDITIIVPIEKIVDKEINKMYLEYKDTKVESDIHIKTVDSKDDMKYVEGIVSGGEGTVGGAMTLSTPSGVIYTVPVSFKAEKNIKVTDIKLLNDSPMGLGNIDFSVSGVNSIQQKWNGPVEVQKGDEIKFMLEVKDESLIGEVAFAKTWNIGIEYEVDGKKGISEEKVDFFSGAPLDDMFAQYACGVDVGSYYEYIGTSSIEK